MTALTRRALTGALLAAGFGAAAQAQPAVNGDGSLLVAPLIAQASGCWDEFDAPNGSYFLKPIGGQNLQATPPVAGGGCPVDVGFGSVGYVGAVSDGGVGRATLFTHDGSATPIGGAVPLSGFSHTSSGLAEFGSPQFAFSDSGLTDGDIGVYSVGAGASYTPPHGRATLTTVATYLGFQFGPGATAIPAPLYGALVQFPVTIDPIDLAYNPAGPSNLSGPLVLDRDAYCRIFHGDISDWSDPRLASIPGQRLSNPSYGLTGPGNPSVPIEVVVRADSSGASSILTRHLARVCDGVLGSSNPYQSGVTTFPPDSLTHIPMQSPQMGGVAVAAEINNYAGAIGYLDNNYISTAANTFLLPAASVINSSNQTIAPSPFSVAAAFSPVALPQDVSDPFQWAQSPDKSVELADPSTSGAYSIVGTTQFLGYTCYATLDSVTTLREFLQFLYDSDGQAIIQANGLAPLPSTWTTAIVTTFLNPQDGGFDVSTALADINGDTGDDPFFPDTNNACIGLVGG